MLPGSSAHLKTYEYEPNTASETPKVILKKDIISKNEVVYKLNAKCSPTPKLDDFFSLKTLSHCVLTDLNAFAWLNKTSFSSLLQVFSLEVRGPAFVCEDKCVRLSKCSSVCVCAFQGFLCGHQLATAGEL